MPTPQLYPCTVDDPFLLSLSRRHREILGWCAVIFLSSLYYVLPAALMLAVALAASGWSRSAAGLVCALALGCVGPLHERPRTRALCQVVYEIFNVRHNVSPERVAALCEACVEGGDRYILGMHPHGVIPLQVLVWVAYADQYLRTPKHGTIYGFGGMASVLLYLPILRTLMGWFTGMPATYRNLKRNLTTGSGATFGKAKHPGRNLYMLPGGLAEIFTAKPGTHTVVWRARRGLCRLALETGARLTPVYVFGGNDFFFQSLTDGGLLARACRACGISITLFWGRFWWLPVVPLTPKHGVTVAIAEPLPARRAASAGGPTEEEVSALNLEYERALVALFDEYKAAGGEPDAHLVVK